MVNNGIKTGDPACPPSIKLAKRTEREILQKIEITACDPNDDEEGSEAEAEAPVSDRPVRSPATNVANSRRAARNDQINALVSSAEAALGQPGQGGASDGGMAGMMQMLQMQMMQVTHTPTL
jgi:hypothetical protein